MACESIRLLRKCFSIGASTIVLWNYMYHPDVRGSYYDIGYRYGTILNKRGFKIEIEKQPRDKLDFGRESEKEVKRFFPEVLEEIRGFADTRHCSYEDLACCIMTMSYKILPSCSVFANFNGSDVVFGRNYDFFYSEKKYAEAYLTCPDKGFYSLGHSDTFVGREDGVNEKGLAIGMTGVAGKTIKPGINFVLAPRCILDKCANVKEGIEVLSNARFSMTSNYLLSDKEGNMAVVEASPNRIRVRRPEKGENFILCTNHFLHPDMQEMENQEERSKSNWDTLPRYTTVYNALQQRKGKIAPRTAQNILANHSGYVCSHQHKAKLGTIWSVVATLKGQRLLRAEGHPCMAKYREDRRLMEVVRMRQR